MITPEEIKLLKQFLNDEKGLSDEEVDHLAKKLSLIVEQIELQEEANKKLAEIREKLDKLDK